jgi:hypothetical protein
VASDSALGTPTIRETNPGFTKIAFQPVTGWTRTTGWMVSIGCRRGTLTSPVRERDWLNPVWTA